MEEGNRKTIFNYGRRKHSIQTIPALSVGRTEQGWEWRVEFNSRWPTGSAFEFFFYKPLSSLRRLAVLRHLEKVHRLVIVQGRKTAWTLGDKSHFKSQEYPQEDVARLQSGWPMDVVTNSFQGKFCDIMILNRAVFICNIQLSILKKAWGQTDYRPVCPASIPAKNLEKNCQTVNCNLCPYTLGSHS